MTNEQCDISDKQRHDRLFCSRISWTAIIVGALTGVGLNFLLNLFSVAIGLSIVTTTKEGLVSLAVGGFLGLVISSIASMFTAGVAAGYLGRPYCSKRNLGVLYGFTTWCLALILATIFASHMGHYVSSYSKFITHPSFEPSTHHERMVAVSQTTQSRISNEEVNAPQTKHELGIASFLMFILFFVGAFSSCLGGHFGMTCDAFPCKKSSDDTDRDNFRK